MLRAETISELATWMTGLETYLKEKTVSLTASEFIHNSTEGLNLLFGAFLRLSHMMLVTPDKYPVIYHGTH